MRFRFVSNVDGTDIRDATADLDPAETLFIVSSKTFTTLETLTNARTARDWLRAALGGDERRSAPPRRRLAAPDKARRSACPPNMFGFWDWVGGRYSIGPRRSGLSL